MSGLFFTSNGDGSYSFATGGYVALAIAFFLIVIAISVLGNHRRKLSVKQLVFAAVAIALAFVSSYLKLFRMPMGGSITLFSMFFITMVGYWYGPGVGVMVGIAYGLLQMIIDPYIISIPQLLVDYPFAFGSLGLSGLFSNKRGGLMLGYITGVLGRYLFAVISGVIFFGMYAPETMSPLVYALAYNGGYLGAEAALTLIILAIPSVRNGLGYVKKLALDQAH